VRSVNANSIRMACMIRRRGRLVAVTP